MDRSKIQTIFREGLNHSDILNSSTSHLHQQPIHLNNIYNKRIKLEEKENEILANNVMNNTNMLLNCNSNYTNKMIGLAAYHNQQNYDDIYSTFDFAGQYYNYYNPLICNSYQVGNYVNYFKIILDANFK